MEPTTIDLNGKSGLTRRRFLAATTLSAAGLLAGCATNPVTGKSQLMMVSEEQEIGIDRQYSPQQFSSDYGVVEDTSLNSYINRTGKKLAAKTHRPHMPYSFQCVNAVYVNAYAFPGGSIAITRGILLKLDDEAELAALLGHELGHVNARHTAEHMSKGMLTQIFVTAGSAALGAGYGRAAADIANQLGAIGAGALLASYSRDNEREADALGMEYMVRSQYSPEGMVELMNMLKDLSKHTPSWANLLFATHPMSNERYDTAVRTAETQYASAKGFPVERQRYMDNTAGLRAVKGAIEEMQKGESLMAKKQYDQAEAHFQTALSQAPDDYAGLLLMSKCLMAQNKKGEALNYANKAKEVNPGEGQAQLITGVLSLQKRDYESAFQSFSAYEKLLPGNPSILFYQGYTLEAMGRRQESAEKYYKFLNQVNQGQQAQYAYQRLKQWRYVK